MHLDSLASYIEILASYSQAYPLIFLFLILFFMAVESSFIPFPSEAVMIPAGFLVARHNMITGSHVLDLVIIVAMGLSGSMLGAYFNYWIAASFGRPFLYRYGRYFFLKPAVLMRSEEIFNSYGEVATFVCRLLPAIRQLISIPAGLSKMNFFRFSLFTGLGAGIWVAILAGVGYYFGEISGKISYADLIKKCSEAINRHYIWILIGLVVFILLYLYCHKKIMTSKSAQKE